MQRIRYLFNFKIFLTSNFFLTSKNLNTSLEGIKDEEVKSLAPTRCQISTKATWSYVVAVSSLRSFGLVSQRDF